MSLKKRLPSFAICLVIVGVSLGSLWQHYRSGGEGGLIASMEERLLDLRFRLRGVRKPSDKVGILAIDEKSLQRFGRWPITRTYYEKVFQNLKKLGADWVGFDVVWSEPERPSIEDLEPALAKMKTLSGDAWRVKLDKELKAIDATRETSLADQSIARTIKDYGKIVLGFFYYASKEEGAALGENAYRGLDHMQDSAIQAMIMPDGMDLTKYPALGTHGLVANTEFIGSQGKAHAFFNNESDSDAIMRWVTLVRNMNGSLMPALSLKLAAQMLKREIVVFFDNTGITEVTLVNPDNDQDLIKIPVDHNGYGRILINHLGPDKTIPHYSLADVYDDKLTPEQKKSIKGKSLILGPTAIAINDQRANPFDAGINGVENHAAVVDNIVSGKFMRRTESIYLTELLIVVGIGLLFAPLMIFGKAVFSGVAVLLFMVGYYYFDKTFWFGRGEWVYMGMPFVEITSLFLSTTLYKYITEEREKKKVKGAFGLYLSPDVINKMLDDPSAMKLGGEKKELTVFFSDVRSFTTISESLTPEKLCELMNEYFTPMAGIILRSAGTLDKYIGDAIMAFWGAPVEVAGQADVAALSALAMLLELDKLRVDLPKKGFPVIDIGIGLNTGFMSVGNMGSGERFTYTVMGDSVNLGARLEGLTKEYGIKVMISEFTKAKLTRKDLITRDLDDIRVKGKLDPVKVFELVRPDLVKTETGLRNLVGEFELGRAAYRKQDWNAAKKHFMSCMSIRPDDGPAELYLRRIEEYEAHRPGETWDGVYTFKHK